MPFEIAQVLYNLAGALALTRCDARIIGLHDAQYRKNVAWVLNQTWLDPRLDPSSSPPCLSSTRDRKVPPIRDSWRVGDARPIGQCPAPRMSKVTGRRRLLPPIPGADQSPAEPAPTRRRSRGTTHFFVLFPFF